MTTRSADLRLVALGTTRRFAPPRRRLTPSFVALLAGLFLAPPVWGQAKSGDKDKEKSKEKEANKAEADTETKGKKKRRGKKKKAFEVAMKEFNECIRIPRRRRIKVTLKPDSDLGDLVAWISTMTCKRFIVPANLRSQKVTLVSPTAVTPSVAFNAFLSALDAMGLTVVPSNGYLKVVQGNWAIQSSIPTYTSRRRLPRSDAIVTQIVSAQNVDVNELLLVLNKMKSRSGDVTAYRPTNSLIITDSANNIRRMLRIIKALDVPASSEKIWVVRLKNADAQEVQKILQQVFAQQKGGKKPVRTRVKGKGKKKGAKGKGAASEDSADATASQIVVDEASNSLIIVASASAFRKIASLIRKLDVATEGVNQRIHVHYLENADAEELANTLASLTGGAGATRGRARRGRRQARGRQRGGGSQKAASLFEGDVKVSADKPTNSLVVVASTKDFLALRRVIKKLDIPRRQVFVEAVIMEVSLDKSRKLGFAYHGGKVVGSGDNEAILFGGVQHSNWGSILINPLQLMGLAVGARGSQVDGSAELLGLQTDLPAFGIMFQALQLDNNINVLSAPHLLTTDNQEAEITVGQNLPFQGGFVGSGIGSAAAGAAAGAAGGQLGSLLPQISVQRQDVALKLKITPHVNESDMVRLELEQEVSDIVSQNFNGLGPATSKRQAKTTVVVRDQQTVVIGGLMKESHRDQESKIPLLGDIPILGYLFKYTTVTKQKTNLMIILTPYVIRDQSDLRRIFLQKMRERREFIERYTAFKPHEVGHEIDYRHKRGLLAEINRVGLQVEKDARMLNTAKKQTDEEYDSVEMPKGMQRKRSSSPAGGKGGAKPAGKGGASRREKQPRSPSGHALEIDKRRAGTVKPRESK